MQSIEDLLKAKANQIDKSGVVDDLHLLQSELDRLYEGSVRATKFKDGVATVETENASLASTIRMQQSDLIDDLNSSLKNQLKRLYIKIV